MPEGNTIHRLAREHNRDLAGKTVRVSSPQGRFAEEAGRLDRRRFIEAEAFGKHLFHRWRGGLIVHVHLGMAGWFYRYAGAPPQPKPSVRMRLAVPDVTIDLIGPPTCELISEDKFFEILARLGPDPLRKDADPAVVWEAIGRRPDRPIGDVLLDQKVISGVGNIYRNEALFTTGIHPLRPSGRVTREEWNGLWKALRSMMRRGVTQSRISTVDPAESPHPRAGRPRKDAFYVYQHSICRRCGSDLREIPLSGRRMFACERCQARKARARLQESRSLRKTERRARSPLPSPPATAGREEG